MTEHTLTAADLLQFTGTENWYRHPLFPRCTYTDGVRHVAQAGGAWWLVEAILLHQADPKARREAFQHWKLTVTPDHSATLTMDDGNENVVIVQKIGFTDFPLPEVGFYLTDTVLMLPGEY